jgi:hypothetical protein
MKRTRTYYQCNICDQTSDDVEFSDKDKTLSKENIHICDDCSGIDIVKFNSLDSDIQQLIRRKKPILDMGLSFGNETFSSDIWVAILSPMFDENNKPKYIVIHKSVNNNPIIGE